MTPSITVAAAPSPLSTVKRAARRPVIPVIPLHYLKNKSRTPAVSAIPTSNERIEPEKVSAEKVPKPASPTTLSSLPTTIPSTFAIENPVSKKDESEAEKERVPSSPADDGDRSEETLYEGKEAVESGREQVKLVDESDKSSTLANESRPATTAPGSSSLSMAAPFYPALQENIILPDDSLSFSGSDANRQSPMHHAHPALVAPRYPRSHSPSPAPSMRNDQQFQHPSEGPVLYENANEHAQHFPNGFNRMGPPPPPGFFLPQDPIAQRYMRSLNSPDAYSPSVTPGISEQQRFPSYPSSVHNDFEASGQPFYTNGINGHADSMHVNHQPRLGAKGSQAGPQTLSNGGFAPPRPMHPQFPPRPMHDHLDGLVEYLLHHLGNPTYADYTLELHYSDCRAHPVKIPGHNLLFARSPVLNNLMATTTGQLSVDGSRRLLRLETEDRFVTSDGFHLAVSRLYGGQLLDEGGPSVTRHAGNPVRRFNLALGYAASGHVLAIPPVIARGVMVAVQLITWDTVEKALDFAIDGGLDSQWTMERSHDGYSRSTYGHIVNELLSSALTFVLRNFPANFDLDTSVPDFAHNSRLPVISGIQTSRALTAHPRLSSMQFGDLTITDDDTSGSPPSFILSKLLIALPFHLLKYILEHSRLGSVEGWATARLRQKVIHTVIEEREKRRLKVLNSSIPNSTRSENRTQWEAVGWNEHVMSSSSSPDLPTITRTWVDFHLPLPSNH